MNSQTLWCIEYSHSRQSFHLGRSSDMLRRNISSILSGDTTDFICVGIFPTKEQAIEAILDFRRNQVPGQTMLLQL